MLKIHQDSKVYVHSPGGHTTGGVELLHQLVDMLRRSKIDAYIVYHGNSKEYSVPADYSSYDIITANIIHDSDRNVEVFPETMTRLIPTNSNTQKFLWWMSVDNFFKSTKPGLSISSLYSFNKRWALDEMIRRPIRFILNKSHSKVSLKKILNECDFHGCQSAYAINFLYEQGCKNSTYLKDYLNVDHVSTIDLSQKDNIVLYNPKKGLEFTQKLIKMTPDITWVPIINMTRHEVLEQMKIAKLYVDFGNHPGKDRLPRECAVNGCCIIVGNRGSSAYYEDIPIDNQYKFNEFKDDISTITNAIRNVLVNYETNIKSFEYYRNSISGEKAEFEQQVKKIFYINN